MECQRAVEQLCQLMVVSVSLSAGTVFCDPAADVPVSATADIISATHRYFTTSCVFLIHTEAHINFNQRPKVVRVLKDSKVAVVTISVVTLFGLQEGYHRRCSRPLYVLPFSGLKLLDGIRQLSRAVNLSHSIWLLLLDKNSSLEEFFTDINIPFDCEFLVAQPEDDHVVGLTEVYRVSPTLPLQTYRFGNWTPDAGLSHPSQSFLHRRNNLQRLNLHVAVNNDSLTIVTGADRGDVLKVGGLFGQMWRVAERYRNFTSHFSTPSLNLHGENLKDGKWNGVVGMLAARQADVSCSDLTMTTSRVDVVDFIEPIWTDRTYIFLKKVDDVAVGWTTFFKPYSWQLWLAFTAAATLLIVCLAAIYYVRSQFVGHTDFQMQRCGLSHAMFHITACFCCQGSEIVPRGVSCRTVHILACFMSVVMFTSYSGALVSTIASRKAILPFKTFQDFLNDGTYRLGVVANSSTISNMKESSETLLQKVYESLLPDIGNLPKRNNEGLRRACEDGRYAYMSPLYVLLTNAATCTLQTVPHAFISSTKAMAAVKGSPYRLVLKQTFRTIRRSGIFRRICSETLTGQPQEKETTFYSVDHNAVSPLLSILFIGMVASILILTVEINYSHSQRCL
ncbi:probable glutamate receptor [Zootermopsis nevadensis]|uniref:Ionotropic glutamate receptor L-glutamate and glycine-binding domain-containing protein n=1 Tax=Zootermopsis nevadensis TaxID=136037 RepID=A0A067R3C8_ZOONE|nr:probable glutamate receptor [Zootermopsis nevadensis]KDR17642.1 hypothetical protein L798_08349 [Zootermopsis nevadensis]